MFGFGHIDDKIIRMVTTMLKKGETAPEHIELPDQDGNLVKIDDLKGSKIVFYTYPTNLRNMSLIKFLSRSVLKIEVSDDDISSITSRTTSFIFSGA